MPRRRPTARVAGFVLAAAVLTGGLTQPAFAAAAATDVPQPFAANSGDACRMGAAKGTIVWHLAPASRAVDGRATVLDRPVPNDPGPGCGDDGRYTVLTLTAYVAGVRVDQQSLRVDNNSREAPFTLTATKPIEAVSVQVCRLTRLPGPPVYCGIAQTYPAPLTTIG